MKSCSKREERLFHKEVPGGKYKLMISPKGEEYFYDVRKNREGSLNLEHGRIVFFESGEEAYDKMVGSRNT
jgi:hypothetical protein